jgi:hypothetical protein
MTSAEDGMLSTAIAEALKLAIRCADAGLGGEACGELAGVSRTLRAYGEAFRRRISAFLPIEVEKSLVVRENYFAARSLNSAFGGTAVPGIESSRASR